jgi:hypothetical protein
MSARAMSALRSAIPVNPGAWQMLRGRMARVLDGAAAKNPHPKGSPAGRCWDFGWRAVWTTRGRLAGRRLTRRANGPQPVHGSSPRMGPGRGRAIIGNRAEWTAADLATLAFCTGGGAPPATADVADMLGKSEQAVRTQRARLRKSGRVA